MIVKCPSCEVEFSADASEGPVTTCPVCAADVPLQEGSIDLSGEASAARKVAAEQVRKAAPEPGRAEPSASRPTPRPEPPPAAAREDESVGFDSPRANENTYSKRSGELKYSEEVIWPSRPAQRRTALDNLGGKPGGKPADESTGKPAAKPSEGRTTGRSDTRMSQPPIDEPPQPRRPRPPVDVVEPVSPRGQADDSARSTASRRPTRMMPDEGPTFPPVDERPTMPRVQKLDLLEGEPDTPDLGGLGPALDIDFPGSDAFEAPPSRSKAAPTQAIDFESLDLAALDDEAPTASGTAPTPNEDALADLSLDSAFSLGDVGADGAPQEKGIFDLDDLVDVPPPAEPAQGGAATGPGARGGFGGAPSDALDEGLFEGGEHTETFFVEASFGGVSEDNLVGAKGGAALRGEGTLEEGFGSLGTGAQGLNLDAGDRGGEGGLEEPEPLIGAEQLGAAPARRAIARSMVKKRGGYRTKVLLLIVVLLVGVGLITSQTSVGIFGLNVFRGGGEPAPGKGAAKESSTAVVVQDDTVVAYRQQMTDLEAAIRTAADPAAKGKAQGDLARLLLKFRERFPKQFEQDAQLVSRLDQVKKEVALTGDVDEMKAMDDRASADPEVAKKQLDRLVKTQSADAEHLVMYGKVELKAQNYEDAIFYFKEAVKKAPDSMETLFYLGVALRESESLDGARKIFEEILRKNPDHLSSLLELARIHLATNALGKAIEACELADKKAKEIKDLTTQFEAHRLLAAVQLKREDLGAYKKELETTIQINPNDEASLLDLARVEDKLSHLDVAIDYVDKYHERNKQFSIDFYATFADLLMKAESADKAKALTKEAVERYPAEPGLQIAHARALELKKEGFAAREVYEKVVKEHPELADAYLQLGRLLRTERDYETAIQVLTAGLEKVEKKEPLYKELVDTYLEVHDTSSATHALEEILKINAKDNETRLRLANLLKASGYLDDAFAQYEILYKNGYIPDEMILAYSEVLRDRGRFDDAMRELELLRQKKPDSVEVLVRIGSVQIEQGKLDLAEETLTACADANPNYELTYYYMGRVYERKARTKDAMDNYRKALQLDPTHDDARFRFAKLLGASGKGKDVEEAVKHLTYIATRYQTQRTKTSEINPLVFLERGQMYFQMKIFGKALADFEQAIALDPTSIDTLVRYAQVLITQEQLDEAKVYLTEAIAKDEKNYEAYFHLGKIFALRKETRAAQRYFEISLKGDTIKYSEVHRMLGLIYRDLGLTPLARRELKKYLQFNPKGSDHKEMEELLQRL